jgi:hypothetical protein
VIRVPDTFKHIEINDITIDENATNNPMTVLPSTNNDNRVSIWGWSSQARDKIIVDNVIFKDCIGQWQIAVGKVKYMDIINCKVYYSTYVPSVDYDRTTFYHTGLKGNMSFNELYGQQFSLTAMEIHGNETKCIGNRVSRYAAGTFIVNDSELNGTDVVRNIVVADNVYSEVSSLGVEFWLEMECDLQNVSIHNNLIYIDPTRGGLTPSPSGYQAKGVSIRANWGDNKLTKNISIKDNTILFKDGFVIDSAVETGSGISISHYDIGNHILINVDGLIIENNTITNSYSNGIYIAFTKDVSGGGTISGLVLKNNTIINPCSGISPTAVGRLDSSPTILSKGTGIYFMDVPNILEGCFIQDNKIIENRSTSLLLYGIYINCSTDSNAENGLYCFANNFHLKSMTGFTEVFIAGVRIKLSNITVFTPALLNSWVNLGFPYDEAGFFKDTDGIVHLIGYLTGGTSGTIFNLPNGYRPKTNGQYPVISNDVFGVVEIGPSGNVVRVSGTGACTLSGISFKADY